jgi:hypothetical protein
MRKYLSLLSFFFCLFLLPTYAHAALSLDGTASNNSFSTASSGTTTLTTSDSNDVIVVEIFDENTSSPSPSVTSVTANGLTFQKRSAISGSGVGQYGTSVDDMEIWWAISSAPLSSEDIGVNLSETIDDASIVAFGVSGAYTSNPWDSAGPVTVHNTGSQEPGTITLSTNNSPDLLLGFVGYEAQNLPQSAGSFGSFAATFITDADNGGAAEASEAAAEYLVVGAPQSGTTVSWGTNSNVVTQSAYLIADAIQSTAPPAPTGGRIIRLIGGIRIVGGTRLE